MPVKVNNCVQKALLYLTVGLFAFKPTGRISFMRGVKTLDPVAQSRLLAQYHKGAVIQVQGVDVKVLQVIPRRKGILLIVEAVEKIVPAQTMLHVRPDGQIIDFPEGWKKN